MKKQEPKSTKKQIHDAIEVLDAIGHEKESEGIKWTKFFVDQWDQRQWNENQLKKEQLEGKRRYTKMEYYRAIAGMITEEIVDLELPAGYTAYAEFSGDGVAVRLKDRWGRKYARAFKPDGTPELDFKVVVTLLVNIMDTVEDIEYRASEAAPQKNGLILV